MTIFKVDFKASHLIFNIPKEVKGDNAFVAVYLTKSVK